MSKNNLRLTSSEKNRLLEIVERFVKGDLRKVDVDTDGFAKAVVELNTVFKVEDGVSTWKSRVYDIALWNKNRDQELWGDAVKQWAKKKGMKLEALHKACGSKRSYSNFTKILRGKADIPHELAVELGRITGKELANGNSTQLKLDDKPNGTVKETETETDTCDVVSREVVERASHEFIGSYQKRIDGATLVLNDAFSQLKKRRKKPGKQNDVHINVQVVAMALSCLTGKPMTEFIL